MFRIPSSRLVDEKTGRRREKKKREIFLGAFFVDLSEKRRIELNSTEFK